MVSLRSITCACATLLAAAGLSGCGIVAGITSNAQLTIYNGQHPQTTDALVAAFTKTTGIKVRILSNDEDTLAAQLEEEGDRTPADVYYTENSNWLAMVDQRGLLAPVDASTLANVPAQDSAADGHWVGVTARVSCMIYNTSLVKASQLPGSIIELGEQRWFGKTGVDSGETDFWPLVDSVYRSKGAAVTQQWLRGLNVNSGGNVHIEDNETLTADVNGGDIAIGVINQYYYYRLMSEIGRAAMHSRIAFFAPHDPGYVEDISGAAVLKASKHKRAAQEFLAFITSPAGQRIIAAGDSFEYPLSASVPANPLMTPLAKLQPEDFTPAELGVGLEGQTQLEQAGML